MPTSRPSLFSSSVIRSPHFVLPQFVAPRLVSSLWMLLGALGIGGLAIGSLRVPLLASGKAVVIRGEAPQLAVLLSPETHQHLKAGQTLQIQTETSTLRATLTTIEPALLSAEATQQRFPLTAIAAIPQPAAVAIAQPEVSFPFSTAQVYEAEIELGSRRLISFLPLIGSH